MSTTSIKRPDSNRTDAAKAATIARHHARNLKRGFEPTRAGHRRQTER